MSESDVDLAELSEKAELLADATGRDKADVMADLLDDGVLNESNKEVKGILDKANEQAEKAKALLMTVLPVLAVLLGGGGAEMHGITDVTGLGGDDDGSCEYPADPEDCSVEVLNHYRGHVADDAEQDAMLVAFKVQPSGCEEFDLDVKIALYQNGYAPNYTHDQQVAGDQSHDFSHVFDDIPVGNWIPRIIVRLDGVEKIAVNFWALDIEEPECEGEALFYATEAKWILENNNTTAKAEIKWDVDWTCDEQQYIEVDIYIVNESGYAVWSKIAAFNTTGTAGDWKTVVWDDGVNLSENYSLTLAIWYQNDEGGWENPETRVIALGIPEESV